MSMLEQMADHMIQGAAKRIGRENSFAKASPSCRAEFLASAQDALDALLNPTETAIDAADHQDACICVKPFVAIIRAIKEGK